jgi:hypothetical protein
MLSLVLIIFIALVVFLLWKPVAPHSSINSLIEKIVEGVRAEALLKETMKKLNRTTCLQEKIHIIQFEDEDDGDEVEEQLVCD